MSKPNLNSIKEFVSPEEWRIAGHDQDEICDLGSKFVVRRIGSQSSRGLVFQINVDGQNYACKVLLATIANPEDANLREIEVSKYLSEKYPDHFQIIYGSKYCPKVEIPAAVTNQGLMEDAYAWHIQMNILPRIGVPVQVQRQLQNDYVRNGHNPEVYFSFLQGRVPDLPALLMVSELGVMDLDQWAAGNPHSSAEWLDVILSVLKGLQILKQENITHNDLHFGNILIMKDGKVKIFDMGQYLPRYLPNKDLLKFLSIFDYFSLPSKIRNLIDILNDNIRRGAQISGLIRVVQS